MSAPAPTVCTKCGGVIEEAYRYTSTDLCETCQSESWGAGCGGIACGMSLGSAPTRRAGKAPADKTTSEFMQAFYSKN